jgi:hypothetical protein
VPELLIGCGARRVKDVWIGGQTEWSGYFFALRAIKPSRTSI